MIGIELGQYALDPFGSGVQRVLQQLANYWPRQTYAEFLVPTPGGLAVLNPVAAFQLLSTTFESKPADHEVHGVIAQRTQALTSEAITDEQIRDRYSSWLVPEMTYDSQILRRIREIQQELPVTMIAYDALPMSHPENYLLTPGTLGNVSEYMRLLRDAQTVVCISEFCRQQMFGVLRRDRSLTTKVAYPGGDHISVAGPMQPPERPMFLRVGTIEARKNPVEIVTTFTAAVDGGLEADLVFVGSPSRVDVAINQVIYRAIDSGYPVTWVANATDQRVAEFMGLATAFLSYGIEGYGIPVLEAIRRGLPVLFDGIQPAGEMMEGAGAVRFPLKPTASAWRDAVEQAAVARDSLSLDAVPSWSNFASQVVQHLV